MGKLKIVSNGHLRDILYWNELTDRERQWYTHPRAEDSEYFRYGGECYCMDDFISLHNEFYGPHPREFASWDGYMSDSFFSGILIRYPREDYGNGPVIEDTEHVIVGMYY